MRSTAEMRLTKHHGAGNDFLVFLDSHDDGPLSPAAVRFLCDRRRGIGADGVLRVIRGGAGAALTMDLKNADGTTAEMSGNGIRCLVQAAVAAGWVAPGVVSVATGGGVRQVEYSEGHQPGLGFGRVNMGGAALGADLDPALMDSDLVPGLVFAATVDMGNPHIVLFGPPVDDATVASVGPRLEHAVAAGANVEFVWPSSDGESDSLTLRVWERGVGETLACGTGSCAAVAAAHHRGLVGNRVRVRNPGGILDVELHPDGIFLAGPTQKVADISVDGHVLTALTAGDQAAQDPVKVTSDL